MRKTPVRIEQRLDGELWLRWQQREIQLSEGAGAPRTAPAAKPGRKPARQGDANKAKPNHKRRWMDGFWAGDPAKQRKPLPATPVALRAPSVAGNSR